MLNHVHPTGFCKREWKRGRGKEALWRRRGQGSVFSVFKIRRPAGVLVRRADEILNTGDGVVSFRGLLGLPFPCVGVGRLGGRTRSGFSLCRPQRVGRGW